MTLLTQHEKTDAARHYRPSTSVQTPHDTADPARHYGPSTSLHCRPRATLQILHHTTGSSRHYRVRTALQTQHDTTYPSRHYTEPARRFRPSTTLQTPQYVRCNTRSRLAGNKATKEWHPEFNFLLFCFAGNLFKSLCRIKK